MNIKLKPKKKKNKSKKILMNLLIACMKIIQNFIKIRKIKKKVDNKIAKNKMLLKIAKLRLRNKKQKRNLNKRKKNFEVSFNI